MGTVKNSIDSIRPLRNIRAGTNISQIGASYSQNRRGVNGYIDRINQGVLATQRAYELSRDDLVQKAVIMALMCQGYVDKTAIEVAHLIVISKMN